MKKKHEEEVSQIQFCCVVMKVLIKFCNFICSNAVSSSPPRKMTNNVTALAEELAQAVELIMHPSSAQQSRMEAYMACERFKEASPLCAQVGLYLASATQFSQNVRHFGLQLMEYTIKFKWNCIGQEEKVFIKVG